MERHQYFLFLQEKFIDLKTQFLHEINDGKNLLLLQGLNKVIATVDNEIRVFHNQEARR